MNDPLIQLAEEAAGNGNDWVLWCLPRVQAVRAERDRWKARAERAEAVMLSPLDAQNAALRARVAEAEALLRRGFAGSRHTHIVIGWDAWERDVEAWLGDVPSAGAVPK